MVNLFPGLSSVEAFVCRYRGQGVDLKSRRWHFQFRERPPGLLALSPEDGFPPASTGRT
jgi:hypothetical protein